MTQPYKPRLKRDRFPLVRKLLATKFGIPVSGVHAGTKFKTLGMDEKDIAKLGAEVEDLYEIEVPTWHLFIDADNCGISDLMDYLKEQLGPEFPTLGYLALTDIQFDARYKPDTDEGGSYIQYEWHDAYVKKIRNAIAEKRCWTAVDGDNGEFVITWGNRVVNRLFNIITKYPIEQESWHVEACDPDEEINACEDEL